MSEHRMTEEEIAAALNAEVVGEHDVETLEGLRLLRKRGVLSDAPRFEDVVHVFRRYMHMPDPRPLCAVLGSVAANRLEGDPVWLALVGPPGGGKSEQLQSVAGLGDVHPTATLTEAALLSGTSRREKRADAKGGLLRQIGPFGIVLCKDFGSVLSMHRDARAAVLAALREVYDGSWTRHLGTDGGTTLHWEGKVGALLACTPSIDRHHAVMASMGERLLLCRLPDIGDIGADEQARRALAHAGREKQMRAELSGAVRALFEGWRPSGARPVSPEEAERLVSVSGLVVRARSAVERDGYSREIELIPGPEAPTRLIVVLDRLLAGLDSLAVPRALAWRVVMKCALDSIPSTRRAALDALMAVEDTAETAELAEATGYPTNSTKRILEDLTAHGLVARQAQGPGKAHRWALSEWARERYEAARTWL